jgi:hypothetical protein
VLASSTVDPEEIYRDAGDNGLWAPKNPPESAEMLHGGLDEDQMNGVFGQIQAWACQHGAFARGFYQGFDRREFQYARQLDGDGATFGDGFQGTEDQRIKHAALCLRFFVPWPALVIFGYQAFFRQDATIWENDEQFPNREYWEARLRFSQAVKQALYVRLPPNRASTGTPAVGPYSGEGTERVWKWVHKQGRQLVTDPGYYQIEVTMWARIFEPDEERCKLIAPTGGVWALALRYSAPPG